MNRIIWALDPFEENSPLRNNSIAVLGCLAKRTGTQIEPVYVFNPDELNLAVEMPPIWIEQYRPTAEIAMSEAVKDVRLPGLQKPKVLVQHSASRVRTVEALSEYASHNGASMIVGATHGREGMERFLLGSFAETLILHSTVPVLIVGAQVPSDCFEHILFPTDLGNHSRAVFENLVELASQLGAKITVFHCVPNPVEPVFQSGVYLLGGGWVPIHEYFARDVEERKEKAESWSAWARERKVAAETVVEERTGNVSASILAFAEREKISLIAMAAQSGPIVATLIGSITRQVVRHAVAPVLIMHQSKQ